MTTNPGWPDIAYTLKSGQHFADVPTVVCRTFHIRLQHLKAFIKRYFTRLIYAITVVEFQKRGLPHPHMLTKVSLSLNRPRPLDSFDNVFDKVRNLADIPLARAQCH